MMFFIISILDFPAALGFFHSLGHGIGDLVGIHDDRAVDVPRCPAHGLNERRFRPQEAFLIGIEDGYQRDFRHIQAFAQEVDADQDVEDAGPQVADDVGPFDGSDIRMEIAHADAHFFQVVRQIFGHLLGQRRHQDAFVLFRTLADFPQQVIHLAGNGTDFHVRVQQARRPDDLLGQIGLDFHFIGPWRSADVDDLIDAFDKFFKFQRPVVQGRRQAETVFDEVFFARPVAGIHGSQLGQRNVRFVDEDEEIIGEIIEKRIRRLTGLAAGQMARIVFDA